MGRINLDPVAGYPLLPSCGWLCLPPRLPKGHRKPEKFKVTVTMPETQRWDLTMLGLYLVNTMVNDMVHVWMIMVDNIWLILVNTDEYYWLMIKTS